MPIRLINLTKHEINIHNEAGDRLVMSVPPSGTVARCEQNDQVVRSVLVQGDNKTHLVAVQQSTFGEVVNLPPASAVLGERVGYIVSRMVKEAVPDRADVFSPGPAVRDSDGRIIGCRGLSV